MTMAPQPEPADPQGDKTSGSEMTEGQTAEQACLEGDPPNHFSFNSAEGHQLEFIIEGKGWHQPGHELEECDLAAIAEAGLLALTRPMAEGIHPAHRRAVTILFSDDATVRELNKTYRGKDSPTNVLSFPSDEPAQTEPQPELEGSPAAGEGSAPEIYLGDAILAYETIKSEAKRHKKPVFEHTAHLVVHAVLHLLGYDHEEEHQANAMEKLESNLMLELGYSDPYAD